MSKKSKKPAAKKEANSRLGGTQLAALKLLAKGERTRGQLAESLKTFIGSAIVGYVDKDKSNPGSLLERGLITAHDGDGAAKVYRITPAGRKAASGKESPALSSAARTANGKK